MTELLIRGGTLVDPLQGIHGIRDILVKEGKVAAVGKGLPVSESVRIIEANEKLIFPGFIDLHVHLREPGGESKETIASGCAAAIAGGFTALCCMPNTSPVADSDVVINYVQKKVKELSISPQVYPVGALTKNLAGFEPAEMVAMQKVGVKAVSDDGRTVASAAVMARAMAKAAELGLKVISHCDDPGLAVGDMNEGSQAALLGIVGSPAVAETIIIARDILLAEYIGCSLHIAHVSTAGAVEQIACAKEKGLPVTAEVTPHHLSLTEKDVNGCNSDFKMNPPLRTVADREALRSALKTGVIDCIATDHAPHTPAEKAVEFSIAPCGVVGLETALAVVMTEMVLPGFLSLEELVQRFSVAPAYFLGIEGGTLKPGFPADITIVDKNKKRMVEKEKFLSRGRNTPFHGRILQGWPVMTILQGKVAGEERGSVRGGKW